MNPLDLLVRFGLMTPEEAATVDAECDQLARELGDGTLTPDEVAAQIDEMSSRDTAAHAARRRKAN